MSKITRTSGIALAIIVATAFMATGCVKKVNFPTSKLSPSTIAKAKMSADPNENTKVQFNAKHLALPWNVQGGTKVYVLWAKVPDLATINLGQIRVAKSLKASLKALTPYKEFKLLLTAEQTPTAVAPSSTVVLESDVIKAP